MKRGVFVILFILLISFNIILGFYKIEKVRLEERILQLDEINKFAVSENAENIQEFEGKLEIIVEDYIDEGKANYLYYINTGQGIYKINSIPQNLKLVSGMQIRINGILKENSASGENEINVNEFSLKDGDQQILASAPVVGVKNVTFIKIKFSDDSAEILDDAGMDEMMENVKNYYNESSYGLVTLNYTILGYYTIEMNKNCDINAISNNIFNDVIINNDVNWLEVNNLVIAWGSDNCPWRGISSTGGIVTRTTLDGVAKLGISGLDSPKRIELVTAHEMGHQFRLDHANYLDCGNEIIGEYGCPTVEYGDQFDVMGNSSQRGHFNTIHKEKLGWINPDQIINNPENGINFITPLENSRGIKAIKIPYSPVYSYYLEYKRSIGFDSYILDLKGEELYRGVLLHSNEAYSNINLKSDSQLLDNTPLNDDFDVVVRPDKPFVDFTGNEIFTVRNFNSSGVEVIIGPSDCNNGADGILSGGVCNGCVEQGELQDYVEKYFIDYTEITQISGSIKTYLTDLQNPDCG